MDSFDKNISIPDFFHQHVLPRMRKLVPGDFDEYTLEMFLNISRAKTGLDNRRRDNDPSFVSAGEKIKKLTTTAIQSWQLNSFESNADKVAVAVINYVLNATKAGRVVKKTYKGRTLKDAVLPEDDSEEIYISGDGTETVIRR